MADVRKIPPHIRVDFIAACYGGDDVSLQNFINVYGDVLIHAQGLYGQTPIGAAAGMGHAHIVAFLLEKGCDVNMQDHVGYTALMAAAGRGDIQTAKLLLEHGARVDIIADNGHTALTWAEKTIHIETLQFISAWDAKRQEEDVLRKQQESQRLSQLSDARIAALKKNRSIKSPFVKIKTGER